MKKNILKITASFVLALVMCMGLMPAAVFAADAGRTIQLGLGGISGYDSTKESYDYIYMGYWTAKDEYTIDSPLKWRVLDTKTNAGGDGLFLLTESLLGTGRYGEVRFDTASTGSNAWQGSLTQAWCKDFAGETGAETNVTDAFTAGELGAVLSTTKSDAEFSYTTSDNTVQLFSASEKILNGDKVFFLSAEEAMNPAYGFGSNKARMADGINGKNYASYWLRSPDERESPIVEGGVLAGVVSDYGYVSGTLVSNQEPVRPALNLDRNAVLFVSAANGGKAGNGIFEIPSAATSEWKLTLLDKSRDFSVLGTTAKGKAGGTIELGYTGAATGTNEYISVIIADNAGARYYGRVAQPASADGQISITIPIGLADGTYTLYVFSEQYNGGANDDTCRTDYASALQKVTLIVDHTLLFDVTVTPPFLTLTEGMIHRTSDAELTAAYIGNVSSSPITSFNYRWYSCDKNGNNAIEANEGGNKNDDAEYRISEELVAGTYYYFCKVSGHDFDGAFVASANTALVKVTVNAGTPVVIFDPTFGAFAGNNSDPVELPLSSGRITEAVPEAAAAGYVFKGWYTESGKRIADPANETFLHTTRLYARYSRIYTAGFNANGGVFGDGTSLYSVEFTDDALSKDRVPADPAKEGNTFLGWYYKDEAGNEHKLESPSEQDYYELIGDFEFYAKWSDGRSAITGVTVSPKTATVNTGASRQFTAAVSGTGSCNTAVIWSVSGNADSGTAISTNGLLTVDSAEKASVLTVTVTAVGDTSKSAAAVVTVQHAVPPKTGDNAQAGLWFGLMMIALAGLCACTWLYRGRKQEG